jgi:hypothetical protein
MGQHTLTVTLSQQERGINLTLALIIEGEGRVRVSDAGYHVTTTRL